jgi:hypothetical protein
VEDRSSLQIPAPITKQFVKDLAERASVDGSTAMRFLLGLSGRVKASARLREAMRAIAGQQ